MTRADGEANDTSVSGPFAAAAAVPLLLLLLLLLPPDSGVYGPPSYMYSKVQLALEHASGSCSALTFVAGGSDGGHSVTGGTASTLHTMGGDTRPTLPAPSTAQNTTLRLVPVGVVT